jgi:NADPH-dependent 2,4-dienoyl-CoA reductase/sulfur reductase-like enzyme
MPNIVSKKVDAEREVRYGCARCIEIVRSLARGALTMNHANPLPVAVIGAGPVGLAAAAHLIARELEPLVFEAGDAVGASVRQWGHVRVFSPWEFNLDPAAVELLERDGWAAPEADGYPTGREIVERYLEPLAAVPEIERALHLGATVVGVARAGIDKLKDEGRDAAPFELVVQERGEERSYLARRDRRLRHLDATEPAGCRASRDR